MLELNVHIKFPRITPQIFCVSVNRYFFFSDSSYFTMAFYRREKLCVLKYGFTANNFYDDPPELQCFMAKESDYVTRSSGTFSVSFKTYKVIY